MKYGDAKMTYFEVTTSVSDSSSSPSSSPGSGADSLASGELLRAGSTVSEGVLSLVDGFTAADSKRM